MIFSFLKENNVQKLFKLFDRYNEKLYIVGGAVRNALTNKDIGDIDFATTMLPEKMIQMFKENNLKHDAPGIKYGTVRIFLGNHRYEITTFRQDKYERKNSKIKDKQYYSRFPSVKFINDITKDAKRRDFTMNAIYIDASGNITDPFNGIEDIKNGIVKFIGNPLDSVEQDPLRILRYFRFCAEGFYKNFDEVSFAVCIATFDKTFSFSNRKFMTESNTIMEYRERFVILNKWKEFDLLDQINEFVKISNERIQEEDERKKLK